MCPRPAPPAFGDHWRAGPPENPAGRDDPAGRCGGGSPPGSECGGLADLLSRYAAAVTVAVAVAAVAARFPPLPPPPLPPLLLPLPLGLSPPAPPAPRFLGGPPPFARPWSAGDAAGPWMAGGAGRFAGPGPLLLAPLRAPRGPGAAAGAPPPAWPPASHPGWFAML
jgi:hypothetical protein